MLQTLFALPRCRFATTCSYNVLLWDVSLHKLENRVDKPNPQEVILRLNRFDYEESKIGLYDYVLKNDNLEKTVQIIMTIIENEQKLEHLV